MFDLIFSASKSRAQIEVFVKEVDMTMMTMIILMTLIDNVMIMMTIMITTIIFSASKSRAQIEVFVKGVEAHLTTTEVCCEYQDITIFILV